jgi:hypothetical protein
MKTLGAVTMTTRELGSRRDPTTARRPPAVRSGSNSPGPTAGWCRRRVGGDRLAHPIIKDEARAQVAASVLADLDVVDLIMGDAVQQTAACSVLLVGYFANSSPTARAPHPRPGAARRRAVCPANRASAELAGTITLTSFTVGGERARAAHL